MYQGDSQVLEYSIPDNTAPGVGGIPFNLTSVSLIDHLLGPKVETRSGHEKNDLIIPSEISRSWKRPFSTTKGGTPSSAVHSSEREPPSSHQSLHPVEGPQDTLGRKGTLLNAGPNDPPYPNRVSRRDQGIPG